jgi:23S rRNA (cytidine1920-2'-O)/16S rRNA (cytidine1409-2'-O)-methyltransferase
VLLQRVASRVYAVDVGRGQLAEALRRDSRVLSMERTNARNLTPATLPEPVRLASIDVSFISLRLVLAPIASSFDAAGGDIVPLVKPQFEAGRAEVRDGVVRDPAIHTRVLHDVAGAALAAGLEPVDVIASPILGPEGNREFLLHLRVPAVADRTERSTRATRKDALPKVGRLSVALAARLDAVGQGIAA